MDECTNHRALHQHHTCPTPTPTPTLTPTPTPTFTLTPALTLTPVNDGSHQRQGKFGPPTPTPTPTLTPTPSQRRHTPAPRQALTPTPYTMQHIPCAPFTSTLDPNTLRPVPSLTLPSLTIKPTPTPYPLHHTPSTMQSQCTMNHAHFKVSRPAHLWIVARALVQKAFTELITKRQFLLAQNEWRLSGPTCLRDDSRTNSAYKNVYIQRAGKGGGGGGGTRFCELWSRWEGRGRAVDSGWGRGAE